MSEVIERRDTDLPHLPAGWYWSTLGDISSKPQYGWTTKADHESGKIKLLRTTDITSGELNWSKVPYCTEEPDNLDKYQVREGDIFISRAGSVGFSYLLKKAEPAVFASYLIRFRFDGDINRKYVYYFLRSPGYWLAIGDSASGIAVPNVNATKLSAIAIPIAPREQQDLIVAEIEKQFSRLDQAIASLRRVKANLKRYKAAVLRAAVEGKLTEEWRKQNPVIEPACQLLQRILTERRTKWEEAELGRLQVKGKEPKDEKWKEKYKELGSVDSKGLPRVPQTWVWATLPQLGELNRGKSKHRPRNDPKLYNGIYPFVQTGDIRHAMGVINSYKQTYSDFGLEQSQLWPEGTLCITIAANIADTAILGLDACFPDSIVGFIPESVEVNTHYVEYFIRTAKGRIEQFAPATAQKNINLAILGEVAMPLPPYQEQCEIVSILERSDAIVEQFASQVTSGELKIRRIRSSILNGLFAGS